MEVDSNLVCVGTIDCYVQCYKWDGRDGMGRDGTGVYMCGIVPVTKSWYRYNGCETR